MKLLWLVAFSVLVTLCRSKSLPLISGDDASPYCQEMNAIADICNHVASQFICSKTCSQTNKGRRPCGTKKAQNDIMSQFKRIVGGKSSTYGDWPWQVALMLNGKQVCAGAVLAGQWIATAAHCFGIYSSTDPKDWSVLAGEHHLFRREIYEQRADVEKIIIHDKNFRYWKIGYNIPDDYDLALLKLKTKLTFSTHVQPICLPEDGLSFAAGHSCKVAGWGHTRWNGSQPEVLLEATVRLVPREICNRPWSYNGTIHGRAICAGYRSGGIDACQYDSGGGLACPHRDQWYLQGVVSWGYECARPHKYGAYTNIPMMKQWIVDTILAEDV